MRTSDNQPSGKAMLWLMVSLARGFYLLAAQSHALDALISLIRG